MKWAHALLVAVVLLAPLGDLDRAVRRQVQAWRTPALEAPMRDLSKYGRPAIVAAGILAIAIFDPYAGICTARACAVAVLPVNLAVEAVKRLTFRTRPDGEHKRSNASFPSGHAASAFTLAWVLRRRWPRYGFAFLLLAGLIAYSRMYLDRHWLSDVVAGTGIGIGWAHLSFILFPKLDPAKLLREGCEVPDAVAAPPHAPPS